MGAVLDDALDVVGANVVAEDRPGVPVGKFHQRAGERDERRVGQRVAYVAGEASRLDEAVEQATTSRHSAAR